MLTTKIRVLGNPELNVAIALWSWASRVAVGVIVETLDVQTSLAPIRIVTYSAD